jgi:hypothetical protein
MWTLLLLGLIQATGLGLLIWGIWRWKRQILSDLQTILASHVESQTIAHQSLVPAWADLRAAVEAVLEEIRAKREAESKLWVGSFLPTDQASASLERQVREAEDHAITAAGPVAFSPMPSGGSETRYTRDGFSRPRRRSGSAA